MLGTLVSEKEQRLREQLLISGVAVSEYLGLGVGSLTRARSLTLTLTLALALALTLTLTLTGGGGRPDGLTKARQPWRDAPWWSQRKVGIAAASIGHSEDSASPSDRWRSV